MTAVIMTFALAPLMLGAAEGDGDSFNAELRMQNAELDEYFNLEFGYSELYIEITPFDAPIQVASESELRTAVDTGITSGQTGTIEITGSFNIGGAAIPINGRNITLITNNPAGVAITRTSGDQRHFGITNGGSLTIGVEGGAGSNITLDRPSGTSGNGGGVGVSGSNTTFTMHGGTMIIKWSKRRA